MDSIEGYGRGIPGFLFGLVVWDALGAGLRPRSRSQVVEIGEECQKQGTGSESARCLPLFLGRGGWGKGHFRDRFSVGIGHDLAAGPGAEGAEHVHVQRVLEEMD